MDCSRSSLKAKEAALLLAISTRKPWESTGCGAVPHVRIERSVWYDPFDLKTYIQRQRRVPGKR